MTRHLLITTGDELRRHPPAPRLTVEQLRRRTAQRTRRRASMSAVAVVAVGVGGVATVGSRNHDGDSGTGASLSSASTAPTESPVPFGWPPRLLIDGDWEITYFNQNEPDLDGSVVGQLTFSSTAPRSETTVASPASMLPPTVPTVPVGATAGSQLQVMWANEDRTDAWSTVSSSTPDHPGGWEPATVAHHSAVTFKTAPSSWVVIVAVPEGSIELRVPAADRAELDKILAEIQAVDQAVFDAALPESVVAPTERAAVVADMLVGVPVPTDFDPAAAVGDETIYSDRTVLAGSVAVQVACAWLDDWFTVWESSDATDLDTILAALESVPSWPMLQGPSPEQSGVPIVLSNLVSTLRDGGAVQTGAGPGPISRDAVADTLGCDWPPAQ